MIHKEELTYECLVDEKQLQLSLFLTKGLWAVASVNHLGVDLECDPEKHHCGEQTFKLPLEHLDLGMAKDAIFFDTRANITIAGSKADTEVEVQMILEGGKKKQSKRFLIEKTPGKSAKLRLVIQYVSALLICLCCMTGLSQTKVAYEIENIRAPSNAAATLLGIEESEIKLIENPTDFSALVQSTTQNFTAVPANFGFQINPFGAFVKREQPAELYLSNEFGDNFLQTSLLSLAFTNEEEFLNQAIGLQFSIVKGKVENREEHVNAIGQIYTLLDGVNALEENDSTIQELKKERLILIGELRDYAQSEVATEDGINQRRNKITEIAEQIENLQDEIFLSDGSIDLQVEADNLATQLFDAQLNRSGLRLDFSSALVLQFPDRSFGNSTIEQAAAWLTFSPNAAKKKKNGEEKNHDWLGIVRYQKQPNLDVGNGITEDANMIDTGVKYLYRWNKLMLGGELIYRRLSDIESPEVDQNSNRYLIDASYNIGNNNFLSFSYGKDFDEQTIQNGNVIAAINFVKGFGKKREVSR